MSNSRTVQTFYQGKSTATSLNVPYRLGKLQERGLLKGCWLDFGCADGTYTAAMLERGADQAVGVDVVAERITEAQATYAGDGRLRFFHISNDTLSFEDASFDGAFVNEVLEHVADEIAALRELHRVLRPGGHLVIMSPNRGFPFECHGAHIGELKIRGPVPLLPWLPNKLGQRFMNARNYWPNEMRQLVTRQGFAVRSVDFVWPVLDWYQWLPHRLLRWYQRHIAQIDRMPVVRRLGLSVFLVAQKPLV